jgi:NDP-sugar pyrophosphorylase family protein
VIQAGGLGERIRGLFPNIPKPLVPIAGRPVLFRQIDWLLKSGVRRFIVLAGYKGKQLKDAVTREFGGLELTFFIEDQPLGSGGCLSLTKNVIDSTSLIVSGDVLFDFDLKDLLSSHVKSGSALTLTLYSTSQPFDGDLVVIDDRGQVCDLLLRPHALDLIFENRVNAAASLVEPAVITGLPDATNLNFEKDVVLPALHQGMRVGSYTPMGYIVDVGVPARWKRASDDFERGVGHAAAPYDLVDLCDFWSSGGQSDDCLSWKAWLEGHKSKLEALVTSERRGRRVVGFTGVSHVRSFERIAALDTALAGLGTKIDGIFPSAETAQAFLAEAPLDRTY